MDFGHLGKRLAKPIDGEARALAGVDEHLLPPGDEICSRGDKFDHLGRNYDRTMAISVDHIVGRNNHPGNTHDRSDVYDMNMDV